MRITAKRKAVKGSGDLKDRITVFQINLTTGDAGGQIETPVELATIWADVKAMTGKRALEASQVIGNNPYEIHTRKDTLAITNDMIIQYKGKDLIIHSAVPNEDVYEIIAYERT